MTMDMRKMDALRELYHYSYRRLEEKFRLRVRDEAEAHFSEEADRLKIDGEVAASAKEAAASGDASEALRLMSFSAGKMTLEAMEPFASHLASSSNFNIRSVDQMRRWLFDVKKLTPVKTTGNKAKGLPAMPWHRLAELPDEVKVLYKPSVDKQSLKILGAQDATLQELLRLNAVGNICKAFLKEADISVVVMEDGQEEEMLVKENGLHSWVASDGKIHGQMSCTETGKK
jgi:hypothetical protein